MGSQLIHPESFHACPNETVTFTCHSSQTVAVQWKLDEYIEHSEMLSFSFNQDVGDQKVTYMDMISVKLSEVTNNNGNVADMTTTLTIIAHGLMNRTNISCCAVGRDNVASISSSILYLAGQSMLLMLIV